MSNWVAFKSQLDNIQSHVPACPPPDKNDTETVTVTDHTSWINRIGESGNKPEDWLKYIHLVKSQIHLKDAVERHNLLSCLFDRAFKAISSSDNKRNEAYAKLFLEYAQVKSEYSPDEAEDLLTYARSIVRRFAIVHIAAAEFEAKQGNWAKAKKILEKAKLIEAEPKEYVREALRNLDSGKTRLISVENEETGNHEEASDGRRHFSSTSSQDSTDELPQKPPVTHNVLPLATVSDTQVFGQTGDDTTEGNHTSETTSLAHLKSVLESAKKMPLRHYQSTPECRQIPKQGSESLSSWKRGIGKQIGLPMRVKKMNLPFSQKEEEVEAEEQTEGMEGVRTLPNETFNSHAHTSGYMSMSHTDVTVPMDTSSVKPMPSSHFKEPMKYITPLASSTHHNLKVKQDREPVPPPSFIDFSLADKCSPESEKDVNSGIECVGSKETVMCEREKDSGVEPMADVKPEESGGGVREVEHNPPPPSLPTPNIPAPLQPQQTTSASTDVPVMSTPSMKDFPHPVMPATPSLRLMESVTVNGNQYFIVKLVGQGGSAKVYQVLDTQKNMRALKSVDLEGATPTIINGFKNEIHLLSKLQYCKSVIKMYDFEHNEALNKLFVVMEFGETDMATLFKSRTASGEGIIPLMVRFYWHEMLTAVQALHKEGVIHSDLKPANFMLVAGNLRLIDFGIANAVQQDKTSIFLNTPMGTLNYMSPEAIMESFDGGDGGSVGAKPAYKISIRSDMWSLGCILYNMVYGKTPFQHIRNQLAKLQAITSPTHHINFPDIPDKNLLDVLKKCLTRDPKMRPTADQLLTHPYLKDDKKPDSPAQPSMTDKMMMNLLQEFSRASPRSVQSISQTLMSQLQTGKKIDLSSLSSKKKSEEDSPALPSAKTAKSTDPSPPDRQNPARVKQENGGSVVKKVRAPLQCINLHQK